MRDPTFEITVTVLILVLKIDTRIKCAMITNITGSDSVLKFM
jgi:hypothetical protein